MANTKSFLLVYAVLAYICLLVPATDSAGKPTTTAQRRLAGPDVVNDLTTPTTQSSIETNKSTGTTGKLSTENSRTDNTSTSQQKNGGKSTEAKPELLEFIALLIISIYYC